MKQSATNNKKTARRRARGADKKSSPGAFVRILKGGKTVVGEKMRSGVTPSVVVKYSIYGLIGFFLVLMQTTFFARFRPFGASADILIASVAAVALFEGGQAGAIYGAVIGYIADAVGGVGVIILPLPYMLVGYFCGVFATDYYKRSWFLFIIFDLCAAVVRAVTTLFYLMATWHAFDISVVIPSVILPEMMSTLVLSPFPALLLLPIYLIFRKKKKELE